EAPSYFNLYPLLANLGLQAIELPTHPQHGLDVDALDALLQRLMRRIPTGWDLGLDRMRVLLAKLGNPERRMPPVIHIAGTNGKGSVTATCRAILEAAGHSVHVH
ncbi:hypothetical protein KC221_22430, partial [Mycobacterium tuberculosis]|nr:hypothetical protein [Mycobacterium tuberculosis]